MSSRALKLESAATAAAEKSKKRDLAEAEAKAAADRALARLHRLEHGELPESEEAVRVTTQRAAAATVAAEKGRKEELQEIQLVKAICGGSKMNDSLIKSDNRLRVAGSLILAGGVIPAGDVIPVGAIPDGDAAANLPAGGGIPVGAIPHGGAVANHENRVVANLPADDMILDDVIPVGAIPNGGAVANPQNGVLANPGEIPTEKGNEQQVLDGRIQAAPGENAGNEPRVLNEPNHADAAARENANLEMIEDAVLPNAVLPQPNFRDIFQPQFKDIAISRAAAKTECRKQLAIQEAAAKSCLKDAEAKTRTIRVQIESARKLVRASAAVAAEASSIASKYQQRAAIARAAADEARARQPDVDIRRQQAAAAASIVLPLTVADDFDYEVTNQPVIDKMMTVWNGAILAMVVMLIPTSVTFLLMTGKKLPILATIALIMGTASGALAAVFYFTYLALQRRRLKKAFFILCMVFTAISFICCLYGGISAAIAIGKSSKPSGQGQVTAGKPSG